MEVDVSLFKTDSDPVALIGRIFPVNGIPF